MRFLDGGWEGTKAMLAFPSWGHAYRCATETLRGVEDCWVKDQNVLIEDGNITGYKVNVEITFELEE
jgi:flavin-binding protein dodecin